MGLVCGPSGKPSSRTDPVGTPCGWTTVTVTWTGEPNGAGFCDAVTVVVVPLVDW